MKTTDVNYPIGVIASSHSKVLYKLPLQSLLNAFAVRYYGGFIYRLEGLGTN